MQPRRINSAVSMHKTSAPSTAELDSYIEKKRAMDERAKQIKSERTSKKEGTKLGRTIKSRGV